ncbi:MAG: regulator [Betaproteobacteria bacterium]|nr:regulator [Betaproteobacteria bacterium]
MDAAKLMELMKSKKQALKQRGKTIKPNPGANRYVLLPGWRKGEEHVWFHDFGQHFIKGVDKTLQAIYVCVDKTFGNACPVCEGLSKAIKMTHDDETVALLKEAVSKSSFLMNVLALDSDDPATPQILEVGKTVFGQIIDTLDHWGEGVFDATAPQIIVINREGKGLNTEYSTQASPKKHTLPSGVLSKLNNLDEYVRQESEEKQRRAIAAINNVAGLLPSPKDVPATKGVTFDAGDDELRSLEAQRSATVSKPSAADIALDDELDDLLSGLTGTDN